jgi:hypothetical protein
MSGKSHSHLSIYLLNEVGADDSCDQSDDQEEHDLLLGHTPKIKKPLDQGRYTPVK